MKIYAFIILSTIFCFSCNYKKPNYQLKSSDTLVHIEPDSFKKKSDESDKKKILAKDTILTFSIDGLSAEGSEVKAHYIRDTIRNATWNIFGETGQFIIYYKFLQNGTVKAQEKNYTYKVALADVNSEKDMHLNSSIQYVLDTNGILLSKINDKNFVNVFTDFKKHVPMTLSNLSQYKDEED